MSLWQKIKSLIGRRRDPTTTQAIETALQAHEEASQRVSRAIHALDTEKLFAALMHPSHEEKTNAPRHD